jgi:hypothetical protein
MVMNDIENDKEWYIQCSNIISFVWTMIQEEKWKAKNEGQKHDIRDIQLKNQVKVAVLD